MDKQEIKDIFYGIFNGKDNNFAHIASENLDVPLFEEPLIGFGAADDPKWDEYKRPEAIGEEWMYPTEWMEGAKTVISVFFPFSEEIKSRARTCPEETCEAWNAGLAAANGYFNKEVITALMEALEAKGIKAVAPSYDPRMKIVNYPVTSGGRDDLHFVPTWSERHAAFVCGLGTFGIHRHLITEKGCAGRYASIIIDAEVEPDERDYTEIYENCIHCGACTRRCPIGAITDEALRNLKMCSGRGGYIREKYGSGSCGKCLTGIPCESRNPRRAVKKQ